MFKNYLKIALRNFSKSWSYSLINIAGLAIGLASFILITLFVSYELSFDRWNPNADRLVRPFVEIKFGGAEMALAVIGAPIGPDIAKELPEVQNFCRFREYGSHLVRRDGELQQNFEEEAVLNVDSTFFELFPTKVLAGDPKTCLSEPNTVAISKTKAEKYFGTVQMAVGEILIFDNRDNFRITAVYEDIPKSSHFLADFLIAMNGNREVAQSPPFWASNNNFHTYLLLRKDTDYSAFREKFLALSKKKVEETSRQLMNLSLEEFEATGQYARFDLQAVPDIHLHSNLDVELQPNGSIQYIWIFGAIALFVLLIACINFMNLTTARSAHRAKEIGVRKVLGSQRNALIQQFLSEAFLMTLIAVVIALLMVLLILPWFRTLSARAVEFPWASATFWLSILLGTGLVSLLAGSYPAFALSGFDPLKALKGKVHQKIGGANLRSALVVFQFATSIVLIIATLFVYNQLSYIQNKQLGFQKDQVIIVDNAFALGDQVQVYKEQMLQQPQIKSASVSGYLPVPSYRSSTTFTTARALREDNTINMQVWTVDPDYLETIGLELVDGRFFDEQFLSDSTGIILNEKAVEILGYQNALDQKIYTLDDPSGVPEPDNFKELNVIGVLKNFHWESLRENIGALCMVLGSSRGSISFKFEATETASVINQLEQSWKTMAPNQPFSYRFMDSAFDQMYESERKIGLIASAFAILAIFISCLGLFGLASFTIEKRAKEIGIRKVLGANLTSIVGLLSRDFLKLVFLSIFLAVPIAWYGISIWLEDFAYRIEMSWLVFIAAGIIAMLIALFSISFQAIRAGLNNPVETLRSE